jgi:hypothetical protein
VCRTPITNEDLVNSAAVGCLNFGKCGARYIAEQTPSPAYGERVANGRVRGLQGKARVSSIPNISTPAI